MSVNKLPCTASTANTGTPFNLLPGETVRYLTPTGRQSFNLVPTSGGSIARGIDAADGRIYVTTQRIAFITGDRGDFDSFVIEFEHLSPMQFSHTLKSPWFGPNYWEFLFFTGSEANCDGLPKHEWFKGKIVFNDGGLHQFVEVLNTVMNDAINNPHVDDELPRYSEL